MENPEEIKEPIEGGTQEQETEQTKEQFEAEKKLAEGSPEKSPEQEITDVVQELEALDQEIYVAQSSIAEADEKLSALREDIGAPPGGEPSPAKEFQNEKLKKLEERRANLNEQRQKWIEQHGRENLPEGLIVGDEEDNREVRGKGRALSEEEKKEDLEFRKEWLKQWEQQVVVDFEKAMRDDWRTKDAKNLDTTIELMKLRVPNTIEKKSEDFLKGTVEVPPFAAISIKWQVGSLFDKLLHKPNFIRKLEIVFDDDAENIAEEDDLKKEEEPEKE